LYFFSALINQQEDKPSRLEYAAPQKALFRQFASHAVKDAANKQKWNVFQTLRRISALVRHKIHTTSSSHCV
jgi:hypothetical protein